MFCQPGRAGSLAWRWLFDVDTIRPGGCVDQFRGSRREGSRGFVDHKSASKEEDGRHRGDGYCVPRRPFENEKLGLTDARFVVHPQQESSVAQGFAVVRMLVRTGSSRAQSRPSSTTRRRWAGGATQRPGTGWSWKARSCGKASARGCRSQTASLNRRDTQQQYMTAQEITGKHFIICKSPLAACLPCLLPRQARLEA